MAAFSKRDQKIIDRLKASGYVGNNVQRNAPLKFLVRPFTTVGVESLDLASWLENEIFSAINRVAFESNITGIAIFPTIFDNAIASAPKDYLTYKKKEMSVFVGLNISFSSWTSGSKEEKLSLLANNITQSIERIPDKYLSSSDRKKLLDIVSQARKRLVDRLLH
jgi:hypothetical protein